MILTGIVYVQLVPANDPRVIGLLVAGFACLIFFALWETFAPLKAPLTPTRLFTNNKGRTLSAPFVVGLVVTMYYFGLRVYPLPETCLKISRTNNRIGTCFGAK